MLRRTSYPAALLLLAVLLSLPVAAFARDASQVESAHFRVRYKSEQLSREQAETARDQAESAWQRCADLFHTEPAQKIQLDLTPDLLGATGFARPGDIHSTDPKHAPLVGVRYSELGYLGIGSQYVINHEVAHVFSGRLAATPLGEGIADWAAGSFNGIPMAPWWGQALRDADLWVDPDALFITGDYEAPAEVDPRTRTAEYTEAALLVRFLVREYGWDRFARFAERYGAARGTILSNALLGHAGGDSPFARDSQRRRAPDPERVRQTFSETLGDSWPAIRERWEHEMSSEPVPAALGQRLVLAETIYGSIRNYEMWLLRHGRDVRDTDRQAVRRAFGEANQAMAAGDLKAAAKSLREAQDRVKALKRPLAVAAALRNEEGDAAEG